MDSRGWIPITLIASFNRIRQFAVDIQLVRDVLMLSSVVQVKDDWVRMVGWEQFVLPDAMPSSVVEWPDVEQQNYAGGLQLYNGLDSALNGEVQQHYRDENGSGVDLETEETHREGEEGDVDVDEDEEEDVVFVMGPEAEGAKPWSPERRT